MGGLEITHSPTLQSSNIISKATPFNFRLSYRGIYANRRLSRHHRRLF